MRYALYQSRCEVHRLSDLHLESWPVCSAVLLLVGQLQISENQRQLYNRVMFPSSIAQFLPT